MKPDYTPEKITHLDEDEIFVFGSNLRRDKMDLLQKVAHNYIMKKEEFQQKISQEEKMLEKLSNKACQALTEEEREMYHNQIVDTESAIECMKEELKKYD